MQSAEIRKRYLEFFRSKGHEIVASAPIVIKNDPTLMFTNAGMNQFKDLFLGNAPVKHARIANSQKCLRVSGKHNDLEEVGVDTYHHTMFEMLGNWSFGNYFKAEAIEWAWELLTDVYKIDPQRLYVTVFGGDEKDGLERDNEAVDIWKKFIAEDRILFFNKKDNFWEMGDTGPCGPCTEIHVDLRSREEREAEDARQLVNRDHPRVIEIWNLVFMQFNRMADGSLVSLPAKHVDTGMGFERLAVALQGKQSNYDTDVFTPLIESIERMTGVKYGRTDSKPDIAIRVISDHVRAVSFTIADGQLPSNTGAGYVIRRILRRAIRYGFSFLGQKEPFIHRLCDVLASQMGPFFPEIKEQIGLVKNVIREEEESFLRTLERGIHRLNELMEASTYGLLPGARVFELYDTFGFPADLTALMASERGMRIDEEGFQSELEQQKERSRKAGKITAGDWVVLEEDDQEEFVGYDHMESAVRITRYRQINQKGKDLFQLVFNLTPFYPEGGGQVGDTGLLFNARESVRIVDTVKENNLILHIAEQLPEKSEAEFTAKVDSERRHLTSRNHTATHLLHHALRSGLGTHVQQKGSLVSPEYLRFDFSHFGKMTDEELAAVESAVNAMVGENISLEEHRAVPMEKAREMNALMFFGEKYGDAVRVIKFGPSAELCGGTHVSRTGEIGPFRIISESAVAAGIRRIEAISSKAAEEKLKGESELLDRLRELLKNPKDPEKALTDLLEQNRALLKENETLLREKAKGLKGDLKAKIRKVGRVSFLAEMLPIGADKVKDLSFELKGEIPDLFAVFGTEAEGKATISCVIAEESAKTHGLNAGQIVKTLARHIEGGGGGQPFFATAGGKKPSGLQAALAEAEQIAAGTQP
jgi:alanyl-tRNA synthetase